MKVMAVEIIHKNDKSLTWARIQDWESDGAVETLDALKNNTVVDAVIFYTDTGNQLNQEVALVKLSELMKCNKSVKMLRIYLPGRKVHNKRI